MAEKKEEMNVDKVTGEVKDKNDVVLNEPLYEDFDPFAERRLQDNSDDYRVESDRKIYTVPFSVMRFASNTPSPTGRKYYSYATGYVRTINGKKITQTIDLEPQVKREDTYDLLDAIFGDGDKRPLEVVRTVTTSTVNGRSKSNVSYAFRVSAVDENNIEVVCTLVPTRGNNDKRDNLLAKLRADGKIDY